MENRFQRKKNANIKLRNYSLNYLMETVIGFATHIFSIKYNFRTCFNRQIEFWFDMCKQRRKNHVPCETNTTSKVRNGK